MPERDKTSPYCEAIPGQALERIASRSMGKPAYPARAHTNKLPSVQTTRRMAERGMRRTRRKGIEEHSRLVAALLHERCDLAKTALSAADLPNTYAESQC